MDSSGHPQAEYIERGPSERAWEKICASWVSKPDRSTGELLSAGTTTGRDLRRRMVGLLRDQMPVELARERVFITYTAALHILADRARLLDTPDPRRPVVSDALFATNLCDMSWGALTAPVTSTSDIT